MGAHKRLIAPIMGLLLAIGLLAGPLGCGSSDNGISQKLPNEILSAAKAAAQEASSVHVVSRSTLGKASFGIDLSLARTEGRVRFDLPGSEYELIRVDGVVYVKGSAAFYERFASSLGRKKLDVPKGTWLKSSSTTGPLAQLGTVVDLGGELERTLSTPGGLRKGGQTTVNAQRVIALKELTKVYEGTLYIATTGKPYPIELVKTGAREHGRTTFSDWNRPVPLSAPSPAVDIASLLH